MKELKEFHQCSRCKKFYDEKEIGKIKVNKNLFDIISNNQDDKFKLVCYKCIGIKK